MRNLTVGEIVSVVLDPLSHGDDMKTCIIKCEVLVVDEFLLNHQGDDDIMMSSAVVRIVETEKVEGWSNLDRTILQWYRTDEEWQHCVWPGEVVFA
jgi:hypothetical protein